MADEATNPATPTPTPTEAPATPTPPPAAPPPTAVTISVKDYEEFMASRTKLAEIEDQRRKDKAEADRREQDALIKQGQFEKALELLRTQGQQDVEEHRRKHQETEGRAKRFAIDKELAEALVGHAFVSPAAARQFAELVKSQLTAEAQGDSFAVRTATFQSASDLVKERLAHPDYHHYVKAGSTGGAGGQATQSAGGSGTAQPPPKYETIGHAYLDHMKSSLAGAGSPGGTGNPQTDVAIPFGLKRIG